MHRKVEGTALQISATSRQGMTQPARPKRLGASVAPVLTLTSIARFLPRDFLLPEDLVFSWD